MDTGKLLDTCVISEEEREEEEGVEDGDKGESGINTDKPRGPGVEEDSKADDGGNCDKAVSEDGDEDGDNHEGDGEDEEGFEDDRVATGPKIAPVTCLASCKNG